MVVPAKELLRYYVYFKRPLENCRVLLQIIGFLRTRDFLPLPHDSEFLPGIGSKNMCC